MPRALALAALAASGLYALGLAVTDGGPADLALSHALHAAILAVATIAIALGASPGAPERAARLCLAGAGAGATVGALVFSASALLGDGARSESPAALDPSRIVVAALILVAALRIASRRLRGSSTALLLDAWVAALALCALVALALTPVLGTIAGRDAVLALSLCATSAVSLVSIGLLGAALVAAAPRERGALTALIAGVGIGELADLVYAHQASAGTYATGELLDVAWPLAGALVALGAAGLVGARDAERVEGATSAWIPAGAASVAALTLGLALASSGRSVAAAIALCALAAALARLVVAIRAEQADARRARVDPGSGLFTEGALLADLDALLGAGGHATLALFDLEGERDALARGPSAWSGAHLERELAAALTSAVAGSGTVYRLTGSERAVLSRFSPSSLAQELQSAAEGLSRVADPIEVEWVTVEARPAMGAADWIELARVNVRAAGEMRRARAKTPEGGAGDPLRSEVRQMLQLFAEGFTTDQVAKALHQSKRTVERWSSDAYRALGAKNRPHAISIARERGLIS